MISRWKTIHFFSACSLKKVYSHRCETHGIDRLDETIPLIIIGSNENINDKTPYIESFVMRGGSILFFCQRQKSPSIVTDRQNKNQDALLEMLDYWVLKYKTDFSSTWKIRQNYMQNLEDDGLKQ